MFQRLTEKKKQKHQTVIINGTLFNSRFVLKIVRKSTCSDVVNGDRDLLRAGDLEVERLSEDWDRRPRFLDDGDLERLRDFFRRESAGELVWLPFFFFSFDSFGSIA